MSLTPAERMGGGAEVMGGAGRWPVTPDSRVRSPRGAVGVVGNPGEKPGRGVLSSRNHQKKSPGRKGPRTRDGST